MLFSSITFLYYFFPIVMILYLITPKRLKNGLLFISSLIFYAWGEPKYLLLMVATILIGYVFGLLLEYAKSQKVRKILVSLSVASGIGLLGYFKYAEFFIENVNRITGAGVGLLHIALPIGISFYIFQMMSYVIDVYRRDVGAQKNLIWLGTYISMFPQLIAGPIVRYSDIEGELSSRKISVEKFSYGIRRFVLGLGKKVLLANTLGQLVTGYETSLNRSLVYVWMYVIALTLQIYFDFSGYSDMAIGLGSMLGFHFPENFDHPFVSRSITEFWRRWHMTLGGWFRDYVYIPLGGNRGSLLMQIRNIAIVWFLTGFWHGASWNFILWGLYFGVLLIIEKLWLKKWLERHKVCSHIYLVLLIFVGFVLFHESTLAQTGVVLSHMVGMNRGSGRLPLVTAYSLFELRNYGLLLIIAAIGSTNLPRDLVTRIQGTDLGAKMMAILEPIFLALVLLISTAYLVNGSYNPFLYFRF